MDLVNEILVRSGKFTSGYLAEISLALIATLLVIYGGEINAFLKRQVRNLPYLLRLLSFVLMCAFGYGLATIFLTPLAAHWLGQIPVKWLFPAVFLVLLAVGWLAERKKQV